MKREKREKILLFYNPYSGSGMFKNNLDRIIEKFQEAKYQIIPIRSERGQIIGEILDSIDTKEYRQIVVAGGDGTINLCVNAMLERDIDLPLGIFPVGTANDLANYFNLPDEVEEMVDVVLGDHTSPADIGVCNGRYFINVAAMGALVDVSQKTDPNLKNTLGTFAYYLRAFGELSNLKAVPVKLITPEQTYEEDMYFMVVMNGRAAGGFKQVAPHSDINDGLLDVILFRKMPIVEMGPLLFAGLQGNHIKSKHVLAFQTSTLRLESDEKIATDVDGEHGESLPLEFSVLPGRMKIYTKEEADDSQTENEGDRGLSGPGSLFYRK